MDLSDALYRTQLGGIACADSLPVLRDMASGSVDLVVTSPPFGLIRKKAYGNADAPDYLAWLEPFACEIHRILKDSGSFVLDLGGSWNRGQPTRSLYNFRVPLMLCDSLGFYLAQEFYWWNPSKLPTPAEWVTIRRVRVKDAVNIIWWFSRTPWPKASNRRVLQPYSRSMKNLLKNGYTARRRPSGHDISESAFSTDNGAAIPPNLIAAANTESTSAYLRYCAATGVPPHPARFPDVIPEFFVRMLTDPGDLVVDPFAGSCVSGEVCERLSRRWLCVELSREYCDGGWGRFQPRESTKGSRMSFYKAHRPDVLWNDATGNSLPADGGRTRPIKPRLPATP